MDISTSNRFGSDDAETPMLENIAVDYKGRPAYRFSSGGWRSAAFIIGVEIGERFAYYGISGNLIMYLTGPLRQSTASAAASVNAWGGVASLLPLLGAFVADTFLGRYRTIALATLLYILALGLLTLSAVLLSSSGSDSQTKDIVSCSPPLFQVILFFFSLYLVAFAQGGHKPCTQAFGADQFDGDDPEECKSKSSFFNWWYLGVCFGAMVTIAIVSYIQENLSWALGFGIPCIAMVIVLVVFFLGTTTYRFTITHNEEGPFVRIGRVFAAAFKNRRRTPSIIANEVEVVSHQGSEQYKFLNKALIARNHLKENGWVCSVAEVEEAKAVLRLVPIWGTCLPYGIVFAQFSTFFTKQGATMERTIVSDFKLPAASLLCFISIASIIFIPIYDRIFVPFARALTRKPSGITTIQRIGAGILMSVFTMIIAAIVEIKRLKTAEENNLVDKPSATIPMSVWWLLPQYILSGITDVFTMVGLQEFFYDEVPIELRSIGLALYLSIFGVGNFLSSFLVSVIEKTTGGAGRDSWFSDNLNRAHLDYFYWLLAGLSALGFAAYFHFARSYIYNRSGTM
ncbi:putative peptide/nitrate transporter [Morus notabilis]|uniref:Putative peptide/nitrate transporter n=1 Tax=Morus notabilis TaxID=981085 RepID=W9R8G8_9ROSA|nr:protein NRT1/ PTR FAMILY 5.10 [Morus notabilis]EXB62487.1 putative peptide/nitrate transporter [Morus notabilis]